MKHISGNCEKIQTKVKGDVWARARVRRRRGRMTDDGSQPATDWRTVTLTLHEGQRTERQGVRNIQKTDWEMIQMNDHQLR